MSIARTVLAVLPGKSDQERILALRVETSATSQPSSTSLRDSSVEEAQDENVLSFEAFRRSRGDRPATATYELCYQSWAERIGWFTQQRVPVTAEQAESLRQVFAAFAADTRVGDEETATICIGAG